MGIVLSINFYKKYINFVLAQSGRAIFYIVPIIRTETAKRSFYCHGTMVLTNDCECTSI